jgi:hypothetical protein
MKEQGNGRGHTGGMELDGFSKALLAVFNYTQMLESRVISIVPFPL